MHTRTLRRAVPALLLLSAASTGTLMASDACSIAVVQKFTSVADTLDQHTAKSHKHAKATLAKWKVWGDDYLAKHGHPYVPPSRVATSHVPTPSNGDHVLKFSCEPEPVPMEDSFLGPLLIPGETPPPAPEVEVARADEVPPLLTPDLPGGDTGSGTPGYPSGITSFPIGSVGPPAGITPGTSTTPIIPILPVTPTVPVSPVSPVTPIVPVTPTVPVTPVIPVTPVVPVSPIVPVTPVVPVLPSSPTVPPTTPIALTPEPSSWVLLATGIAAMWMFRRSAVEKEF